LVGNTDGKKKTRTSRRRWKDKSMDLRKVAWVYTGLIWLTKGTSGGFW
jgi:hypothetical protein